MDIRRLTHWWLSYGPLLARLLHARRSISQHAIKRTLLKTRKVKRNATLPHGRLPARLRILNRQVAKSVEGTGEGRLPAHPNSKLVTRQAKPELPFKNASRFRSQRHLGNFRNEKQNDFTIYYL